MPNGDPDFADSTLPKLEAFFAPFAKTCERFADLHNIKIEKYYHEFPAWSFLFRHPAGGIGKIDLVRKTETTINVWRYWWHDDYDAATRSIKNEETQPILAANANVDELLETSLSEILTWNYGDWDSVHDGYESSWHKHWTKDQFKALDNDYPVLKQ